MKLLLYCTKAKPFLNDYRLMENCNQFVIMSKPYNNLNGKIVAECDYEVEEITLKFDDYEVWIESNTDENVILKQSCLDGVELYNYLGGENEDKGYVIHIKNVKMLNEPKELNTLIKDDWGYQDAKMWYNYFLPMENAQFVHYVNTPPKRMMKVHDNMLNDYILIPVSSQEMCRVANKEQTSLVRRDVLKEML